MKPNTSLLFLFWMSFIGYNSLIAQDYTFTPVHTIKKKANWIEIDNMKHLYQIEDGHTLVKYNSQGEQLFVYNENNLGDIHSIDVSNPFRIMVYFYDFSTIVFLDRTLSETRRFDLVDFDLPLTEVVASASDNTMWLFDNDTYTLKKINNQNQVVVESTDLALISEETISPNRLIEYDNNVYLNVPEIGILVFDVFGNYIKTIELLGLDYFQLYENQLFYIEDESLQSYHLLSFFKQKIKLPILKPHLQQLCISQELLYLNYSQNTEIYQLKKK